VIWEGEKKNCLTSQEEVKHPHLGGCGCGGGKLYLVGVLTNRVEEKKTIAQKKKKGGKEID